MNRRLLLERALDAWSGRVWVKSPSDGQPIIMLNEKLLGLRASLSCRSLLGDRIWL